MRKDVVLTINKFLWEMIWEKKLIIDFSIKSISNLRYNDEFRFVIVDKDVIE
ncbi:MAG: hypothetical protein STSR0006_00890 [Lentimicrobium sp.]